MLDPANSPELMARLRSHWREPRADVAWVGEGWRDLVGECHHAVAASFPRYELTVIKQKHGALEFYAFPRAKQGAERTWTGEEYRALEEITASFRTRSELICEWCGDPGRLRLDREYELTLCDTHDAMFDDPPENTLPRSPNLLDNDRTA